jgi:hypothetical protein
MQDIEGKFTQLYAKLSTKARYRLNRNITIAIGIVTEKSDKEHNHPRFVFTLSGNASSKEIDAAAEELGLIRWKPSARAEGRGAVGAPYDAEQLFSSGAEINDFDVWAVGVNRRLCQDCEMHMKDAEVPAQAFPDGAFRQGGALYKYQPPAGRGEEVGGEPAVVAPGGPGKQTIPPETATPPATEEPEFSGSVVPKSTPSGARGGGVSSATPPATEGPEFETVEPKSAPSGVRGGGVSSATPPATEGPEFETVVPKSTPSGVRSFSRIGGGLMESAEMEETEGSIDTAPEEEAAISGPDPQIQLPADPTKLAASEEASRENADREVWTRLKGLEFDTVRLQITGGPAYAQATIGRVTGQYGVFYWVKAVTVSAWFRQEDWHDTLPSVVGAVNEYSLKGPTNDEMTKSFALPLSPKTIDLAVRGLQLEIDQLSGAASDELRQRREKLERCKGALLTKGPHVHSFDSLECGDMLPMVLRPYAAMLAFGIMPD